MLLRRMSQSTGFFAGRFRRETNHRPTSHGPVHIQTTRCERYVTRLRLATLSNKADFDTVPEDVTTWEWLFESKESSPLHAKSEKPLGAFVDAESKERLDWAEVKSKSTALSSCLIRQYGLKPGDTVSLFSGNTIWYPVCMFAVIRAGKFHLHDAETSMSHN